MGKKFKYDSPEVRLETVEKFLEFATGKPLKDITKEEILGISWKREMKKYDKKAELKIISARGYLINQGRDASIFALLKDAGIAQKFGITQADFDVSWKKMRIDSHTIYGFKTNRMRAAIGFLHYATGKPLKDITKEEILGINWKQERVKYDKTAELKIGTVRCYLSKHGKDESIFALLEDVGIAQKFGISRADFDASCRKRQSDSRTIYGSKTNHMRAAIGFLHYATGKPLKDVTKEEILGISWTQEMKKYDKTAKLKITSMQNYLSKQSKDASIFTLLEDAGIAQKFGISNDEFKRAINDRRSHPRSSTSTGAETTITVANRPIVIIPVVERPEVVPEAFVMLPDGTIAQEKQGNGTIRMVLEERRNGQANAHDAPNGETSATSLFEQVLARFYPGIPKASVAHALTEFEKTPLGSSIVLVSPLRLDSIFLDATQQMGFEVEGSPNTGFRTEDAEVNQKLAGHYCTQFKRLAHAEESLDRGILGIMLQNGLSPDRYAAHELSKYSRKFVAAENAEQMSATLNAMLDWLQYVRESGVLGE